MPAYRLGERWFGERAALIGVWVGACYPLRIFFEGESLDVTLFTFLFLAATWKLWQALEGARRARVFLAGLLYGAAALTRPNVLLALPLIAFGVAVANRVGWARLPALGPDGALGVVIAIAPVTVHNWRAEGVLMPVAANGGVNFFLGNQRGATGLTPFPPGCVGSRRWPGRCAPGSSRSRGRTAGGTRRPRRRSAPRPGAGCGCSGRRPRCC